MTGSTKRIIRADSVDGIKSIRNYAYEVNNFEVDTGKLKGFADTPVNNKPSGTFTGTPTTLTKTYSTSNPLDLTKSLRLARSANAQGQGYYFTFQPMRRDVKSGAIYEVEFDHELISGTFVGSSDPSVLSDLIVGVWDAANSKHLDVTTQLIQSMVTDNVYTYKARFQLPVNGTTFNFWIYNPSTTATAFTIAIDNLNISRQVTQGLTMRPPVGTIIAFGSLTPPTGFLYCNGQQVSRTQYSKLFAAIGTSYGSGDGSTTFHLPDLRGRFLRGANNGSGNDPDSGSRSASNSGGATGDNVGSLQGDAFQSHGHSYSDPGHFHTTTVNYNAEGTGGNAFVLEDASPAVIGPVQANTNSVATGITINGPNSGNVTSESRPKNVNVAYHICFDDGNVQASDSVVSLDDVGSVQAFARSGTNAPTGFLFCDGSAVSRSQYSELFNAIGTSHGSGDGSTTFNLPDYRGRFLRGANNSTGRDPDAGSRTAMNSGGATGDNVGSVQNDAFQTHGHSISDPGHGHNIIIGGQTVSTSGGGTNRFASAGASTGNGNADWVAQGTGTGISVNGPNSGTASTETRPKNANVNYFIKYKRTNVIAVTESKVAAKYTTSSGQTFSGSAQRVNFGTQKYDTFGLVQTGIGTWEFTAKEPGIYITKGLLTRSGVPEDSDFEVQVLYNSVVIDNPYIYRQLVSGSTQLVQAPINSEDYLDAGQKIWVTLRDPSGGSLTTNAKDNWISIRKV